MAGDEPVFFIRVIVRGQKWGVLLEKQGARKKKLLYCYEVREGLEPHIAVPHLKDCDVVVFRKFSRADRLSAQAQILMELKAYAEAVQQDGDAQKSRPVAAAYHASRGYPDVIEHFFHNADEKLRDFLENRDVFEERVLEYIPRERKVRGRGAFQILGPEQLVLPHPHQLFTADQLLERDITAEPMWFRPRGPVAVDFAHDYVYPRKSLLEQLQKALSEHAVVLLEGEAASGKSVLVRHLAYGLMSQSSQPVYYFKYRLCNDFFSKKELINDIRAVEGLVILEDAHLAPELFQEILVRTVKESSAQLLVTTRPPPCQASPAYLKGLDEYHRIPLPGFQDANEIIQHVLDRHAKAQTISDPRFASNVHEIAKGDFWLLAFALLGGLDAGGKGDPVSWLRDGVRGRLEAIRELDPRFPEFPQILVALAPLSLREIPTAAGFLYEQFHIAPPALDRLFALGEIERVGDETSFYYRLPHSSLAGAYWAHGQCYRGSQNRWSYRDYVRHYLLSHQPNGLLAVVTSHFDTMRGVLAGDDVMQQMPTILRGEHSYWAIDEWLAITQATTAHLTDEMVDALVERIIACKDYRWVSQLIAGIRGVNQDVWRKACKRFPLEDLASKAESVEDWKCLEALVSACGGDMCDRYQRAFRKRVAEMPKDKRSELEKECLNLSWVLYYSDPLLLTNSREVDEKRKNARRTTPNGP